MFVGQKSQEAVVVGISNLHHLPYLQHNEELLKLGYQLKHCANDEWGSNLDICILPLDHDQTPPEDIINSLKTHDIPFIISLNDEAPTENLAGHLQKAVGFLFGEPSLNQLALEIEVGLHIHRERTTHSRRVERVSTKIQNNRDIGIATGLIMAQTHLSALEVFAVMKSFSRNGRVRIVAVAKEIINLFEQRHPDLSNKIKIDDLDAWLVKQLKNMPEKESKTEF